MMDFEPQDSPPFSPPLEHDGDVTVLPPPCVMFPGNYMDPGYRCPPSRLPQTQMQVRKCEVVPTSLALDNKTAGLNFIERELCDLHLGKTAVFDGQDRALREIAETAQFLLESWNYSQNLYEQNNEGDTALHHAIIHQNSEDFHSILKRTYYQDFLDTANEFGQTPLHLAVAANETRMARTLVACGADLTKQDTEGRTPLHIACEKGDLETVKILTTPLTQSECDEVSSLLPYEPQHSMIPQKSSIFNYEGEPCIHTAAKIQRRDIIAHLVDKCGHDINSQEQKGGKTILHNAVESENEKMIYYLLQHNETNPYAYDYSGRSPLELSKYHPLARQTICCVYPHLANDLYDLYEMESSSDEDPEIFTRLSSGD